MSAFWTIDWGAALALPLGFTVGFSVGQGSTCAVTAGKQLVHEGRPRLFWGFVLASGVAGLLCLPLAWTVGMRAGLPPEAPIVAALIAGAMLLAAGALVNDACLFGTLSRISQGELRFLAVPVGLATGYAGLALARPLPPATTPNSFGQPGDAAFALVAVSAVMILAALSLLRRERDAGGPGRWPLRRAMVVLGVSGTLLFVLTPGWTYADAVRREVRSLTGDGGMERDATWIAATVVATLAGAVTAGVVARHFRYRRPTMRAVLRSFGGGAMMAVGAAFVPGGNDSLLLWSVPGGSLSGLIAYAVMTATIVAALFVMRAREASRAPR